MRPRKITSGALNYRPGTVMVALVAVLSMAVPAPGLGAPAPTAAELLKRMDDALPRERTVVLSGAERMPDRAYQRLRAPQERKQRRRGGVLDQWSQRQEFKPGLGGACSAAGVGLRCNECCRRAKLNTRELWRR